MAFRIQHGSSGSGVFPRLRHSLLSATTPRWSARFASSQQIASGEIRREASTRSTVTVAKQIRVPQLQASSLEHARQPQHVHDVHTQLRQHGILKVNLTFADPESEYLKHLVTSLHQHHGHQLPISHSATRGWFWDVRPSSTGNYQTENHQARSETMEDFAWHTDCSYEHMPPRLFALHVLQHDRLGGGTLMAANTQALSECLSETTREALTRSEFAIAIPPEFIKDAKQKSITASLMSPCDKDGDSVQGSMRFRRDLVTPLTDRASKALLELDEVLRREIGGGTKSSATVHLSPNDFPAGSIIMMDNRRWLHARTHIKDAERHLRRIRWDAVPFPGQPVEASQNGEKEYIL